MSAIREGAQESPAPVVPWPHEMTFQPPVGGVPFGSQTVPETAIDLLLSDFDL